MQRITAWLRTRLTPPVVDVLVVVVVLAIAAIEWLDPGEEYRFGSVVLNAGIGLATILPLLARRHRPVLVLALSSAAIGLPTVAVSHDLAFWGTLLPLGLAYFTVARLRPLRVALLALLAPAAGFVLYVACTPTMWGDPGLAYFFVIVFGIGLLAGRTLRRDADRRAALADGLARLEAEQDTRRRLAVLDERTALARDLHDVVAHALSLMLVQTRAAQSTLDSSPDVARRAVLALESAGRDATAELRRMLGLLRTDGEPDATTPTQGLAELPALVERMRSAGLDVELQLEVGRSLPPGFDVSAYRIVQEALTNVVKHAGPTAVRVRVATGDALRIDVVDAGARTAPATAPGRQARHGLVGMAERVGLYGGTLVAEPLDQGFAVRARLPIPVSA